MKRTMTEAFIANKLYPGRMVGGSKSGYRKMFPDHLVIFNSNIVDKNTMEKVWYGDMDLTLSHDIIEELADEFVTEFVLLYEMAGRFDNEDEPDLTNYVW